MSLCFEENVIPGPRLRNLTGQRFGRITVLGYAGSRDRNSGGGRTAFWFCLCSCGNVSKVATQQLHSGKTQSCGCLQKEQRLANASLTKTHGEYGGCKPSPEMAAYTGAKTRCTNPNVENYADYGGRGIEFRFNSFDEFLADIGRRPGRDYSLDRKDVNGHYEAGNVRWATASQQARNIRKATIIEYKGESKTIGDWCDEFPMVKSRFYRGWCVPCMFEQPKGGRCDHRRAEACLRAFGLWEAEEPDDEEDDVIEEQERNYNRMVGDSLKRH